MDDDLQHLTDQETIESWVMGQVEDWRDYYESNYEARFDEYYRLWRAIWDPTDSQRDTERSRIITPALQQAVESNVAEIEEATFGRGKWFDISDNLGDTEQEDVQYLRNKLLEDFDRAQIRKAVSEVLINSAVYGTGIAEIVLTEIPDIKPATQPMAPGVNVVGTEVSSKTLVKMNPVLPQNFLIEPVATSVEESLGVAIDEFVSRHYVEEMQELGVYNDVYVAPAAPDSDLEPDQDITVFSEDKVRLTRWYGKVPRELLEEHTDVEESGRMVEAIVVLANGGILLKAEESPYIMKDRPVVAFAWDVVPGRFWGRGVCEKGYMTQKALDTEIRARIDALALTVHPMMGIEATSVPRGEKFKIRPGKIILTNGNPRDQLHPLTFGDVSQSTFVQAQALQTMVQQATGAVDSAGIAGQVNGEATAAGISMSLGAIIKRHKRTLINFQQGFLIPFVQKAAYRYMQFDTDEYPVNDFKFKATSSLGIIAREYEVTQLTQLLQTMSPDSPLYSALIESIVDNMNLSNREELVAALREAAQPDEAEIQRQAEAHQSEMDFRNAQTGMVQAQANESNARAQKYQTESKMLPEEVRIQLIEAVADTRPEEADEFGRMLDVANLALKERELKSKERMASDKHTETMAKLRSMMNSTGSTQ